MIIIIMGRVCVICQSWRLKCITQTERLMILCYHAKTKFNIDFIMCTVISDEAPVVN